MSLYHLCYIFLLCVVNTIPWNLQKIGIADRRKTRMYHQVQIFVSGIKCFLLLTSFREQKH